MQTKIAKKIIFAFSIFIAIFTTNSFSQESSTTRKVIKIESCTVSIIPNKDGQFILPTSKNDFKFAGYEQNLENSNDSRKFGFSMECQRGFDSRNDIANDNGGSYDDKSGHWSAFYVSDQDKEMLAPATKIIAFDSPTGTGFVRLTDDVIGDEKSRDRKISYCVFDKRAHQDQAICGDGIVMKLSKPQENFLPDAIKVLRSLQFISNTN
ncbi:MULTISPECIES: hypothetical protein [unclassified Paraburkholderia]|uniref:hypothetical protein n=1 Tax=unclassified Paraburkholderia TaxID=2615204 RepID=UPI002AB2C6D0|nr:MULTISPECIES: hypothetical protein [unclassified Paraburkholderia]